MAFPTTALAIRVFMQLTTGIVDISTYIRFDTAITITRGARKERTRPGPATADFTLKNTAVESRRFSPRNTTGPWYGLFSKNTPITIEYDYGSGWVTRFNGKVPDWSPKYSMQTDGSVKIRALGKLYDVFNRPSQPINSPMYNSITAAGPVLYWPLEGSVESGLPGGVALTSGSSTAVTALGINFTGETTLPGSKPNIVVDATTNLIQGWQRSFSGHWQFDWFFKASSAPASDTIALRMFSYGTINYWDLILGAATWRVKGYTPDGTAVVDTGAFSNSTFFYGQWAHLRLSVRDEGGGTCRYLFSNFPVPIATGNFATGTYSGTFGDAAGVQIAQQANIDGWAYGHIAVYDDYDFSATDDSADGYDGETTSTRFARLMTEAGISYGVQQTGSGVPMGVQPVTDLASNLREIETLSRGFVYETVGDALQLQEGSWRYDSAVGMSMTYSQVGDIDPVDDLFSFINKYTATGSDNKGQSVAELTTGPLSTLESPDGVGVIPGGDTYNVNLASQLPQLAHFALMQGTIDELRFDSITINFHRDSSLLAAWSTMDIGSRFTIGTLGSNSGKHIGGSTATIDQILEGYQETFTSKTLTAVLFSSPYAASDVGVLDDTTKRLDCSASYLNEALDTTETGVDVGIFDNCSWGHNDGDYSIMIGGEEMTVTAVSAVSTAITFGAAGASASADSAAVSPGLPAGGVAGNLLLCLASCRDTTSTPTQPTGYSTLLDAGNVRLFAKVHSGSESAPSVGFTGGAGDTVQAQIARLTGSWGDLEHVVINSAWQANGSSAQNIQYPSISQLQPNCIVLWLGWKADDCTSVATITGATEIGEVTSTLGGDATIVWDYQLASGRTLFPAGSFAVTGGASAISVGAVVVLRATQQTLTVTRSVNGATLSHSIGDPVHVKHPIKPAF